jgi:hypothetical protein
MHRPDATAHGDRSGDKPSSAGLSRSGPHPGRQIQGGIGGERRNQNRQRDQNGIVKGRMVVHVRPMLAEFAFAFCANRPPLDAAEIIRRPRHPLPSSAETNQLKGAPITILRRKNGGKSAGLLGTLRLTVEHTRGSRPNLLPSPEQASPPRAKATCRDRGLPRPTRCRPTVAIGGDGDGDGDFMFVPSTLWTAAHHRIPLLYIVHNNRAYHQEYMYLQAMAARHGRGITGPTSAPR